ncbi:MAG: hypothetical protein HQL70_09615 [Magnetococcales bacterium]|nr:hypothetical protein [Magnetococcales bacterium]
MSNELITVTARPHPFRDAALLEELPHGKTLAEIVTDSQNRGGVHPSLRDNALISINGVAVPYVYWGEIIPQPGTHVVVSQGVHGGGGDGGGKNVLRVVLTLALVVIAPPLAAASWGTGIGTAIAGAFGGGAFGWSVASAMAMGVVTMAGGMIINALAPMSAPQLPSLSGGQSQSYQDSPTYSLSGARNHFRPFGVIPVVLGVHKHVPPLGARSYTEISGNDEYFRMLVVWGYGPLKIENIKIGTTPIEQFSNVQIETFEGRESDGPITLMPNSVTQDQIGVALVQASGWTSRTSQVDADELSVDIAFPRGLAEFDDAGEREEYTVTVEVQARPVGGSWSGVHTFTITDKVTSAIRFGHRWTVSRGQYDVRLRRTTVDDDSTSIVDDVSWSYLRSITNEDPIQFDKPLAMTALRIKASEQLQGSIDNLTATVSSYAQVWNGSTWAEAVTNNPASLARLVLQGPANARPRTDAQLNLQDFQDFYDFCDTNGYTFNQIRDFKASVPDTFADVVAAGRGNTDKPDGQWGIIIDQDGKPITQHFTPRNSWGFKAEKTLFFAPHALRVRLVNAEADYQQDEIVVYADGYNSSTATEFEGFEFSGITDPDLAWKHARYHMAAAQLRPEVYTLNAALDHLVCRRGSLVQVAHDAPLWGLGQGRVKAIATSGGNTTGVTLDELVAMEAGKSYTCRFRLPDHSSLLRDINTVEGESGDLIFTTPIATASGPSVGDLAMFGEQNLESVSLIVKSIERQDDFKARLTLVDAAPEIYDADTGTIPTFESKITSPTDVTKFVPPVPTIDSIQSGTGALQIASGAIISRILVALGNSGGTARVARYKVRFRRVGGTAYDFVSIDVAQTTAALSPVIDGESYEIAAQSETVYGVFSEWSATIIETVIGQEEPPNNVTGFAVNVIASTVYLSWTAVTVIDMSHYRLRWSSALSGATWDSSVDVATNVAGTSITLPAQVGTYLIKAVDRAGNESTSAASVITSVAALAGLNYIAESEEQNPTWTGVKTGVAYSATAGGLILDYGGNIYDETNIYDITNIYTYGDLVATGTYESPDVIDLAAVYTSRVTADIDVAGVDVGTNIYDETNIYDVGNIYGTQPGQFSAQLEISTTEDDPTDSPTWTEWQPFLVGDYTARAFKTRVVLNGTPPNISPVVSRIKIQIDMPDRIIKFGKSVASGGSTVTFSPAFYIAPEIGLSVQDGAEGDKYTITNLTKTGFDIAFTNSGSPVARTISGIAQAYGEVS